MKQIVAAASDRANMVYCYFECLLSLYGHTMHVPTLWSISLDRNMISLYSSTMHVVKLEPYVQALYLA